MGTSLYDLTVPVFVRGLASLAHVLEKGAAHAAEAMADPIELLEARLYPDMAPLTAQVQRASDTAKGAIVRIGGVANVSFPDEEKTFNDLQARIVKTIAFLDAAPREALDGREEAPVTLSTPGGDFPFDGRSYALTYALPNFYFHMTTAYALLRMNGAPIGKLDYLGKV